MTLPQPPPTVNAAGAAGAVAMAPTSALRLVLASPFYRGATMAMFLSGLGFSAAAPRIATFLVDDLHASLSAAGLFYLTNLTGPVAGYLIGARSDRTGHRLGLFRWCAVAGAAGWIAIAFATRLWVPYVIGALVLGFALAATSQVFAALHDELAAHPSRNDDAIINVVRMAVTAGWVVGPVAGSILAGRAGLRAMLFATAIVTLAQILPLGTLRTPVPLALGPVGTTHRRRSPGLAAMLPLLAFTGLYVCVYAGESIKYAYLPIYMDRDLGLPAGLSGAIIGIQPLVELALMPVAVIVARRTGMVRLMTAGAAFGVGANICFTVGGGAAVLFAGQILMGVVWGIFATLGIIVAQRLLPTAVATASAVFISSTALSSALGGVAGGLGVAALSLPHVFLIPAGFALAATIGLAVMNRFATHDL